MRLKFFGHRGHWNLWPDADADAAAAAAAAALGFAGSLAGRFVAPFVLFFFGSRAADRLPLGVASIPSMSRSNHPDGRG
jgi:hypothetical protein